MPVANAVTIVNSRTRASGCRSIASACRNGGRNDQSSDCAQYASRSPAAPPIIASSVPSVRSCRIRRPRLAPSDRRTAISFWRTAARASRRFATLAHAISSTRPTIPISTPPAATMLSRNPGLTVACASGTDRDAASLVVVRVLLSELRAMRLEVRFGLLHADAGLQSAGDVEREPAPAVRLHQLLQKSARRLLIASCTAPTTPGRRSRWCP